VFGEVGSLLLEVHRLFLSLERDGAVQLQSYQPVRSLPLKIALNPVSGFSGAYVTSVQAMKSI
jgi:hypothetical protein